MVLMTGTVLAQAIGYLISPILTRIYTAEEMADLGLYLRIVGFLAALATARYELSLPLPKNESHSYLLYRLSLKIALIILISTILITGLFSIFSNNGFSSILFIAMVVIGSGFMVFNNLGANWAIRQNHYTHISTSRIAQSVTTNAFKWIFGILGFSSVGLILSTVIGYIISIFPFVKEYRRISTTYYAIRSKAKTAAIMREYRSFPLINLPHVLVDLGRDLLIATLIIGIYEKEVFGYFSHSYNMLRIPLLIIGSSIAQVLFKRAADYIHDKRNIQPLIKRTVLYLFTIAIIPFAALFFFGEPLFAIVFGENWATSGVYAEILSIWFLFNFISSTLSTIPIVLNKQKSFFYWGLVGTILQIAVLGLFAFFNQTDFLYILKILSVSQTVFTLLLILRIITYTNTKSH